MLPSWVMPQVGPWGCLGGGGGGGGVKTLASGFAMAPHRLRLLVFHKFSTELLPLIYEESVSFHNQKLFYGFNFNRIVFALKIFLVGVYDVCLQHFYCIRLSYCLAFTFIYIYTLCNCVYKQL